MGFQGMNWYGRVLWEKGYDPCGLLKTKCGIKAITKKSASKVWDAEERAPKNAPASCGPIMRSDSPDTRQGPTPFSGKEGLGVKNPHFPFSWRREFSVKKIPSFLQGTTGEMGIF